MNRKKILVEDSKVLYTRLGASRKITAGRVYFCGCVLTLLESQACKWSQCGSVIVWFGQGDGMGMGNTYQTLKNTSAIRCNTGCNVPQLVLQLGQLELLGDFLRAQVCAIG